MFTTNDFSLLQVMQNSELRKHFLPTEIILVIAAYPVYRSEKCTLLKLPFQETNRSLFMSIGPYQMQHRPRGGTPYIRMIGMIVICFRGCNR